MVYRHVELSRKDQYPDGASEKEKKAIRRFFSQFLICGRSLLKRSYGEWNLMCLYGKYARRMMKEIHEESCGTHINGHLLAKKIICQDITEPHWTETVVSTFIGATSTRSMPTK